MPASPVVHWFGFASRLGFATFKHFPLIPCPDLTGILFAAFPNFCPLRSFAHTYIYTLRPIKIFLASTRHFFFFNLFY